MTEPQRQALASAVRPEEDEPPPLRNAERELKEEQDSVRGVVHAIEWQDGGGYAHPTQPDTHRASRVML